MFNIDDIRKEYEELLQQLSNPELISNFDKFEELSKRKSFLEKVLDKSKEIEEIKKRIEENKEILKSKEDQELSSLAETDINLLSEKEKNLEKELGKILALKENDSAPKSVLVEIRAGTGGDEAALFATDLFKMYSKFAQNQNWRIKVLDSKTNDIGGFKEIIFEAEGSDVFRKMKNEAGVHRVQRIPLTEKMGRIHTSTASVAILQKPKKTEIKIRPDDLKIDFYRSSGPGGQYVNKRETAVRITHLPSGLVVTSQTQRNQLENKENALSILEARLYEKKETEESLKTGDKRKTQIGKAKRVEKIRTYNFPQDRITDHRIKKSFHNINNIMAGKLEPIIDSLISENPES